MTQRRQDPRVRPAVGCLSYSKRKERNVLMEQDRRKFMARSVALAAAPMFVPRSAWGANDRLAYAVIGTGGRGRYISRNFQKLGAQCVAVSDAYRPNLEKARGDWRRATRHAAS